MQNDVTVSMFQIIKSVALALAFSLLSTVILATVLLCTPLPDTVIYPVNQVIKALAIALGTISFIRGEKGFIKGGVVGLIFTALSFLAFSAIGGDFSLSWLILLETLLAVIIGALCGALAVNMRRDV
jgi:putative membrane protein (TIGR04086 family)